MKKFIISALAFGPIIALAQSNPSSPNLSYLSQTLIKISDMVKIALPLVVGLALLAFFWGVAQFIWGGEDKRDEGKQKMIWGIVGLFVMVSVWGLVGFLGSIIGVQQQGGDITVPSVQGLQ